MPSLGVDATDLDEALDANYLDDLCQAIDALKGDAENGGEGFRVLFPKSVKPKMRLNSSRAYLRQYAAFRRTLSEPLRRSNWSELEELRDEFMARASDFVDFEQQDGICYEVERQYKDAMIASVSEAIISEADSEAAGRAVAEALTPQSGPILRWQTFDAVRQSGPENERMLLGALGRLARSDALILDAISDAVATLTELREQGERKLTKGEILSMTISVVGIARPADAAPFKIGKARAFARRLTGDRIFAAADVSLDEVQAWLDLLKRIFAVMRDTWDWRPRDLIDVQSFAWIVLDDAFKANDSEGSEDEESADMTGTNTAPSEPLNQILYGPPGTGKTWMTAQIAVRICNGDIPGKRAELMMEYERLRSAGRIALTTFHQSLGYEEFVEGLRPVTDAGDDDAGTGGFRLEPQNGIFREICALAEQARAHTPGELRPDLQGRRFFKMSLGRTFDESHIYDAALAGEYVILGWGGDIDWSLPAYDAYENILAKWREFEPDVSGNTGNVTQVYRFRATMRIGDIIMIADGNHRFRAICEITGDYQFQKGADGNHRRAVKWLRKFDGPMPVLSIYERQFSPAACYQLDRDKLKVNVIADLIEGDGSDATTERPNYVLIIDEINRANISKVLGELITLIEPDKRLGSENVLKVTLPYSKDNFGVPSNLYIVGTMNTADRSIAMLDTALRRRFEFIEMMPDYDVIDREIEGVHLGDFLAAINQRVEWLFDREHQIGHAYLTVVQDKAALDEAMRRRIIPLLAEYFYEDWEKVRVALNDSEGHFIEREELQPPQMLEQGDETRMRFAVRQGHFPIEGYSAAIT